MEPLQIEHTFGIEDMEDCPECYHAWFLTGSSHFSDCRYFSLDDDRDEEPSVYLSRQEQE